MLNFILVLLFVMVPTTSESQTIKAQVGKKNNYIEAWKVEGGQPTDGKDLYRIRFAKHEDFERLVLDIHEWKTDENLVPKGMGPPAPYLVYFGLPMKRILSDWFFSLKGCAGEVQVFRNFLAANIYAV